MSKLITKTYKNNSEQSLAYGKYYARILHTETLTTNEFANHIKDHGSPFDRATIIGVLTAACDCLVELTMDSKKVQLGDLGTFYMSAETEGAEQEEKFTANNIKKVHLRFLPNQKREYPLDSVSLRKRASLMNVDRLTGAAKDSAETADGDNGDGEVDDE